ncbi:thioredoxin domain-containing protein 9-like [Homarus americanus]|uniref:Thioredoxin domain-containing protein 9 n=1 Tax=Homarus americanus TaxID=6706 RepID=A0A8J5JD04_HOMAM|nr:thioredoxin domain-containing protein 9-like [Homarus americanus]XP_042207495.1 thioredoxin domain-containing protein 9-like [Homarus americanus]XP_042207496.1 thioredoxin domain-containing protein 9-like [Homarus americanus]XP_042207499.1 thioredoxin domain-containing protein 9-like [Homarus americanus]XP_042207500.1 thioredoxin domain-containing protein 9-like [Homarus americanus]KAG7154481.1 Thioredoxin domain-containing protein 9-like [Homarus americanus]
MAGLNAQALVEKQLTAATQIIERQLDAEINRLDNLESDDLDAIRRERLAAMKERQKKKQDWINNGHGDYSELSDEKEFFETTKKSENVVCHFYRDQFVRCKIADKHLEILAKKHIETKFCKINAEKAPFLTERLSIRVLPTLCLVKNGKTKDYIVGFTDLGNTDEFSTDTLEWRIGRADVLEYHGDLMCPPTLGSSGGQKMDVHQKKTIRGGRNGDSDDSDSDY